MMKNEEKFQMNGPKQETKIHFSCSLTPTWNRKSPIDIKQSNNSRVFRGHLLLFGAHGGSLCDRGR